MSGGKTGYQTRSIAPSPITIVSRRSSVRPATSKVGRRERPGELEPRVGEDRVGQPQAFGELALVGGVLGGEPEHRVRSGLEQLGVVVAKAARLGRAAAGARGSGPSRPPARARPAARSTGRRRRSCALRAPRATRTLRSSRRARSAAARCPGGGRRRRRRRAPAGRREASRDRSSRPILESAACSRSASSGSSTWSSAPTSSRASRSARPRSPRAPTSSGARRRSAPSSRRSSARATSPTRTPRPAGSRPTPATASTPTRCSRPAPGPGRASGNIDLSQMRREIEEALRETASTLSRMTDLLAVATAPPLSAARVHRVEVLQLQPEVVMVVVIASNGAVTKRMFNFAAPVDPGLVEWASSFLNERLSGLALGARMTGDRLDDPELGPAERAFLAELARRLHRARAVGGERPLRRGRRPPALGRARSRPAARRLADAGARAPRRACSRSCARPSTSARCSCGSAARTRRRSCAR